jgi:hypothetical protein
MLVLLLSPFLFIFLVAKVDESLIFDRKLTLKTSSFVIVIKREILLFCSISNAYATHDVYR